MTAPVSIRRRTRPSGSGEPATPLPMTPPSATPRSAAPVARPVKGPAGSARAGADYDVGYGKPPPGRPFVPGQSGNSGGRPKGSKNFQTLFEEALNETVIVREKGREVMISKRQVGARRLANKVAEGDPKVLAMLLKMTVGRGAMLDPIACADQPVSPTSDLPLDGDDVLAELVAMALRANSAGAGV